MMTESLVIAQLTPLMSTLGWDETLGFEATLLHTPHMHGCSGLGSGDCRVPMAKAHGQESLDFLRGSNAT